MWVYTRISSLFPLPDWSDVEVPQEPEPDIDEVIKKATTPTPAPPPPESVEVELEVSDGETTAQGLIDIEPSLLSGDAAGDVSESFDLSGDVEEEAGPELVSTRDAIAPPPMEKTESGTDAAESDEIEIGDEGIELDFGDEEESGAPEPKVVIEATTSREDDTTPEQIVLIPEDEIEQELDDNDEDVVEVTDRDELAECLDEEDQSLLVSEPPEIPIKRAMLIVEQPGMGVEYLELVEDGTRSVNLTTSKVTNRSLTLGFKNGKLMLTGAGGDFSLEVRVNDERALLRGDRKLRDGDVLHLRGGSLRVSLGLKGGKPGGGAIKGVPIILAESSFLSPAPKLGLQMMEKQITDLPGSSEVALECWTSKMCSELGKLRRLEGDERSKAQTRIMRSMGYLVAKACSSGTPDVFFKFIEKTENVADLAALLQAFEKSESLTEVKLDASVLGEIQSNLKVDRERNFYEQMWALVQAMPGDMLLPIKHSQFIKDLKQITDTPEGRREILATLNPLMNPLGVAAWEDDGKLNIAQVNHMIEDEGVNYVFVHEIGASNGQPIRTGDAKLAEFDSLAVDRYMVSDEYGRAPHKDMDRLIIIRGNRNFRSGQFAHQHRLQSFLNIVSGYDASISTNGRPEEAKVLSETVSMAAALYYSGFDDDSITRMLEQFSQAKDGMNGDEMLSARRLLGFMNTNLELSPIAALRLYLDSEYSAALGVGLMDLRGIKRSELNVGKKKTILGVVDKLVERARKTLAPKE